jgi:hypothetical protein
VPGRGVAGVAGRALERRGVRAQPRGIGAAGIGLAPRRRGVGVVLRPGVGEPLLERRGALRERLGVRLRVGKLPRGGGGVGLVLAGLPRQLAAIWMGIYYYNFFFFFF